MVSEDAHFLLRSSIARKTMACLVKNKKAMTPKHIAKEIDVARDNVSTRILWLTERGLVKCINPEARKWRFYAITDKGKLILKEVEKLQ